MSDPYATLGVARTATADEIKSAYRRLARQYHPDTNPGDADAERQFKEIASAYEILSDPERRARFDQFGTTDPRLGFDGGSPFSDLFEAFFGGSQFGGGRVPTGPRPGADLEVVADVAFETAALGGQTTVELKVPVPCTTCEGQGTAEGTAPTTCATCGGRGQVQTVRRSILGQMVSTSPCPSCNGFGEIITNPCSVCHGDGRVEEAKSYTLDIPAGVDNGAVLRLSNRGAAGLRGGGYGDLYVHVRVAAHPHLHRDGDDLIDDLTISMTQAALGTVVEYAALDTEEELTIPAGTQSGRVVRLRGRGVPHLRGRGRGDLLINVVVETPTDLSSEEKEVLRRFAELRGEELTKTDQGWLGRIRSALR
jgi:molecular chaperone DnaJ